MEGGGGWYYRGTGRKRHTASGDGWGMGLSTIDFTLIPLERQTPPPLTSLTIGRTDGRTVRLVDLRAPVVRLQRL